MYDTWYPRRHERLVAGRTTALCGRCVLSVAAIRSAVAWFMKTACSMLYSDLRYKAEQLLRCVPYPHLCDMLERHREVISCFVYGCVKYAGPVIQPFPRSACICHGVIPVT